MAEETWIDLIPVTSTAPTEAVLEALEAVANMVASGLSLEETREDTSYVVTGRKDGDGFDIS